MQTWSGSRLAIRNTCHGTSARKALFFTHQLLVHPDVEQLSTISAPSGLARAAAHNSHARTRRGKRLNHESTLADVGKPDAVRGDLPFRTRPELRDLVRVGRGKHERNNAGLRANRNLKLRGAVDRESAALLLSNWPLSIRLWME
jgi:hypothetical protein